MTEPVVVSRTVDDTLKELRNDVLAYERRYQCGSREMLEALRDEKVRETAEVAQWMHSFHNLVWLAERSGRTIGIPTTTTRMSTTATYSGLRRRAFFWRTVSRLRRVRTRAD